MINDKELLELAAKAASIGLNHFNELKDAFWLADEDEWWNPLTDDGDALRLAVKCHIEFYEGAGDGPEAWAGYWTKGSAKQLFSSEPFGNDKYAATRRAIVRAAAEIGKGME